MWQMMIPDNIKIKEVDREIYNSARGSDPFQGSASAFAMFEIEKAWIEEKIAKLNEPSGRKIGLEIGCGCGGMLPWIASHCENVIGLDHSIKEVKDAASALSGDSRFAIVVGDAEIIPLRECSIDLVFCGSILHHLPDYGKSIHDLYGSLSVNGILIATEPCAYNPFAVIRRKFFPSIFHTPDERPFPPNEIIAEFKRNFECVYYKRFFLFSINSSVVERVLGKRIALQYLKVMKNIDSVIMRLPLLKELCWRIDLVGLKLPK
jgi:ubiquinone/menaquinone biosynthesis C-methylase UbiE